MNKKLLKTKALLKNRDFWIIVLILVVSIYTGFFKGLPSFLNKGDSARVEIDFGDKKRTFEGKVIEGMSVLDAILASSRAGKLEFQYALLNNQTNVLRIDGFAEDGLNKKTWNFYLNEEKIKKDEIHRIKIKSGDDVLIRFE